MTHILEVNAQGDLKIPSEMLPDIKPRTRYQLQVQGDTLILRPQQEDTFLGHATPSQRAERFREWAAHRTIETTPVLSDEALSRETIYD